MAQWPHERSLVKKFADKPFALIGVHLNNSDDTPSVVKRVMLKDQLDWRSFVDDGSIAEKWKPSGTPAFFILDPDGVIRHKWPGSPGAKVMETALEKLLTEVEKTEKDP